MQDARRASASGQYICSPEQGGHEQNHRQWVRVVAASALFTLSDYHISPHTKKQLRGRVFADEDETKAAAMEALESLVNGLFQGGFGSSSKAL